MHQLFIISQNLIIKFIAKINGVNPKTVKLHSDKKIHKEWTRKLYNTSKTSMSKISNTKYIGPNAIISHSFVL